MLKWSCNGQAGDFFMIKLIAIVIAVFSFYMALSLFLSNKRDDNVIDIKDYRDPAKSFKQIFPFLLVAIALSAVAIFFLSRLGVNVGGIFQRLFTILPLMKGFFPF